MIADFETVSEVTDSWDKLKRIPTYEEVFGVQLYERMFEIAPDAWGGIFQWTKEDFENKDPKAMKFVVNFVKMLDQAVHLLGPDMEIVQEQLFELGKSHTRYGVTPKHFELMGKALVETLQKVVGRRSFTDKTNNAWKEMYAFMSSTMIEGAAADS